MAQTLTEIRAMLDAAGVRPRKRLGQNFLIDHNLLAALVELADVKAGNVVLEVGPGTGTLTDAMLAAEARMLAVEIDARLADLLTNRSADQPALRLIHGDVLSGKHAINPQVLAALSQFGPTGVHLVSNLPYKIATPLVCLCLLSSVAAERDDPHGIAFTDLTVTVQQEVAQRLTAEPGSSAYGPASVLVALLGKAHQGKRVPASAFWPRPKVAGRMLRIDVICPPAERVADLKMLSGLLAWLFHQRRKKIGSAGRRAWAPVSAEAFAGALAEAQVDRDLRPECVTPDQFARISSALASGAVEPSAP